MKKSLLLVVLMMSLIMLNAQSFKPDTVSIGGLIIPTQYVDTSAKNWKLSYQQLHNNILYFIAAKDNIYDFKILNDDYQNGEFLCSTQFNSEVGGVQFSIYCSVRIFYIAGSYNIVLSNIQRSNSNSSNVMFLIKAEGEAGEDIKDRQTRYELICLLKDMSYYISKIPKKKVLTH